MNPQTPNPQVPPPSNNVSVSQQVIERLKTANNVLVTVSNNPTVDQLAACIGFTLVLNKLDKHGTAVFSGAVPPAISFLEPDKLLEKNTDSLRDFIIALDKSKADKLRYKIEDKFVKIFITPYRTSIDEKDLEFSHGDFNVDVVLALGVHQRDELDQAITAHGRILHDATVITINNDKTTDIGAVNWREENVSSLSEMMVTVTEGIKEGLLDPAIATAFLTGIVAETDRFSNGKTKAQTMSVSARLMSAGAHQQLIAVKLEEPKPAPPPPPPPALPPVPPTPSTPPTTVAKTQEAELPKPNDGSLYIPHEREEEFALAEDEIHIDDEGTLRRAKEIEEQKLREQEEKDENTRPIVDQPPSMGGTLTANTKPEPLDGTADALSRGYGSNNTLLQRPAVNPVSYRSTPPATGKDDDQTLEELEESVHSPHVEAANSASNSTPPAAPDNGPDYLLEPIKGLNSKPVNLDLSQDEKGKSNSPSPQVSDPTAPPPVPPPMTPPSYLPPGEAEEQGSFPPDTPL